VATNIFPNDMNIFPKASGTLLIYSFLSIFTAFGHEPEAPLRFAHPHAHDTVKAHMHLGWESRYFSEGRDSLDGDSLFVSSFEMGWEHLAGGIWYGSSPDQRYDELQLTLALTQSIGDFEFYGGYTHLRFPIDGTYDNEIGAGIAWSGLPMDFEISADAYYSFDADGYFAEIAVSREFSLSDCLALNFSIPFGINQGYVGDGHDGANNIALRLGAEYALSDTVSLNVHGAYSWALERDSGSPGDDLLIDFFHGSVGLQWSF